MSLSLSSLLNPSSDADADGTDQAGDAPPRKDSLPPISHAQSPEQTRAPSLPVARQGSSQAPANEQDAIAGLTALAGSPPAPASSPWPGQTYERRSSAYDHRPGSSGMQLPMPTPSSDARKMSSPTLEHYHVPSRSPEQARAPSLPGITLPPLQDVTPQDEAARASAHEHTASLPHDAREDLHPATSDGHLARTKSSHSQSKAQSPAIPPKQLSADDAASSPAAVKEEAAPTPTVSSPSEARRMSTQQDMDGQPVRAVATLKSEHSAINQSPLRESSVPVPSTETPAPEVANPKKRPAPAKKKGTATTTKKAPPAKKRKVEPKRSATPSSVTSKTPASKLLSSKGTPANSSPAPSTRSQSAEPNDEAFDDDEDEEMEDPDIDDDSMYCLCRKRDTGTFMIGCDGTCDDWFHGKCVGIDERDKNLIDKYICPNCTKAGIGRTTWKRICRREGCRLPAKIGKSKNGKDSSKYCSDECGVKYFREMVAKTRGREEAARNRASRRKSGAVHSERPHADDDLGARGGVLAAGELKALIVSTTSAADFHKLGAGVLSPPATPDARKTSRAANDALTESETAAVQEIARAKDAARETHRVLKDRMKFVTLVKQAAARAAAEKELKAKELCGYDSRLEWSDARFAAWRDTPAGRKAFELETLEAEEDEEWEVCERKKCARHLEWNKLAVDDVRAHMADNGDAMRELDRAERGIRERAALRAKAGIGALVGEGSVEVHEMAPVVREASEAVKIAEEVADGVDIGGGALQLERPVEQPAVVESVECGEDGEGDTPMAEAAALAVA